jgi:4-amino-4-deoxy-L-arabinose transferase-like glycosyltransferase
VGRERVIAALLLTGGLGSAFLGQFCFVYGWRYGLGLLFWGVAALLLGVLLWQSGWRPRRPDDWQAKELDRQPPVHQSMPTPLVIARVLAGASGVVLALLAGWLARERSAAVGFSDLFWMWLVGVTLFLLAFVPSLLVGEMKSRLRHLLRSRRVELVGLAVLLLLALVVRAVNLEHIPPNMGGDEGEQALSGLDLLGPPMGNPFGTGWFSVPNLSFLPLVLSMRIFGDSVAGLRTLSAVTGALTVLTTFLLAQELWGRRVAWLAAGGLAFSHFHIHFSRLGTHQIADGLLITSALYFLLRGLRSRRALDFVLAGAVTGLGWYAYFGARLIGIIIAVYLAWRMVAERRFLARYGGLLVVLSVAALLVVAPLFFHYADYPAQLASRVRQVSAFSSGDLAREQALTGYRYSPALLFMMRFWRTFAAYAFHYPFDPVFYYNPTVPLLDFISGALFVFGLLRMMVRCFRPANGLLLLWFGLAWILGWVLTDRPPCSQRMVIVIPALTLLAALGLDWAIRLGQRTLGPWRHLWNGAVAALLVVAAVLNLWFYFGVYTPRRIYGNPTAEIATVLSRYLKQQDDDYVVYFYASPAMYWGFGTLRFMARGVEGMDAASPQVEEFQQPDLTRGARFVFLPHRLTELEVVRTRYPDGVETSVYSTADGRLLYVMYEVGH